MKHYSGRQLDRIAFSVGGLGAGNICIRGNGSIGDLCVRNAPGFGWDPLMFSALTIPGNNVPSRIIEGPVPDMNITSRYPESGLGLSPGRVATTYGLPHFSDADFSAHFPFAEIQLVDNKYPLNVHINSWSPFIPSNENASSLPFAALEYTIENRTDKAIDCVYYFVSENFMRKNDDAFVRMIENGFCLEQPDCTDNCTYLGSFACRTDKKAYVDAAWLRGSVLDTYTMLWKNIQDGVCINKQYDDGTHGGKLGATIAVPMHIPAHGSDRVILQMSWFVPGSDLRVGLPEPKEPFKHREDYYQPWYSCAFDGIDELISKWANEYNELRSDSMRFSDAFFGSDLPEEIIESVSSTLSILKSPTVLRLKDGSFWGFEGCADHNGCCAGTTSHVWNYQQALCHLFPRLERSMRKIEYFNAQSENGHQSFRLSIPEVNGDSYENFHSAADGQLGGIIKAYREWHIFGDNEWLRIFWPKIKQSLNYCVETWDPAHMGAISEVHHNTYDIEFWGPGGMCTGYYLSALKAACLMGEALGDDVSFYRELYAKGREFMETSLFNGEYFYQKTARPSINQIESNVGLFQQVYSAELYELIAKEGPKYQYGTGCLSDAVVGIWLGEMSGITDIIDEAKLISTLNSIYKYNFKKDLSTHSNTQRPGYAMGNEGGLLLCSWPRGGKPSLPFIYSDEVWTGIEYHVASHLISKGMVQEGLEIVRTLRSRYDGTKRNPYCEYECGYWYARALSSYGLLQAYTGVFYDAVKKVLHYSTRNAKRFRTFLSTETGFGTVEVSEHAAVFHAVYGNVEIEKIICDD